ncbi:MAG: hypothetical protein ACRCU1_03380 [Alsobacter sp.]
MALEAMLKTDLPTRDWVAANAELRQTFASLRHARRELREVKQTESADTAWMVAKLKRFAAMNAQSQPHPDGDSVQLPEKPDSAVGE